MEGTDMILTAREMITRSIDESRDELGAAQRRLTAQLNSAAGMSTSTIERVLEAQHATQLWTNVEKVLARNDALEQPRAVTVVLDAVRDHLQEVMLDYVPRNSTSLVAVAEDLFKQAARVAFLRDLRGLRGSVERLLSTATLA